MNRILLALAVLIIVVAGIIYVPKIGKNGLNILSGKNKSSPAPFISPEINQNLVSPKPSPASTVNSLPESGLLPETGL